MIKTLEQMETEELLLPIGMTEFDEFCDTIIDSYAAAGMVIGEVPRDQLKWVIASFIIELKPDVKFVTGKDIFFRLRSAAAKQVAGQYFHDFKQKQLDKVKQEELEKKAKENELLENSGV